MTRTYLAFLATALVALLAAAPAAAQAPHCHDVAIPVALAAGLPADSVLAGTFCVVGDPAGRTVQVLLHGAGITRAYWDWPTDPWQYSYVRYATAVGYATLNLDRIGAGVSSRPPAAAVTTDVDAFTVHQAVQALRAGLAVPGLGVVAAARVALVGHSMGSFVGALEAATYHDVDAVVLTGFSHAVGPALALLPTLLYPAQLDPVTAPRGLPLGYLTTVPGAIDTYLFYHPAPPASYGLYADPAVVAAAEAGKDGAPVGEFGTIGPAIFSTPGIAVPVLVADGNRDQLECLLGDCAASGTLALEAAYFAPAACLQTFALPNAGHAVNLHRQAPLFFGALLAWGLAHAPPVAAVPPVACP